MVGLAFDHAAQDQDLTLAELASNPITEMFELAPGDASEHLPVLPYL